MKTKNGITKVLWRNQAPQCWSSRARVVYNKKKMLCCCCPHRLWLIRAITSAVAAAAAAYSPTGPALRRPPISCARPGDDLWMARWLHIRSAPLPAVAIILLLLWPSPPPHKAIGVRRWLYVAAAWYARPNSFSSFPFKQFINSPGHRARQQHHGRPPNIMADGH